MNEEQYKIILELLAEYDIIPKNTEFKEVMNNIIINKYPL